MRCHFGPKLQNGPKFSLPVIQRNSCKALLLGVAKSIYYIEIGLLGGRFKNLLLTCVIRVTKIDVPSFSRTDLLFIIPYA